MYLQIYFTVKRKQIYNILKKIEDWKNADDLGDSDPKKMVQTGQIILSVATTSEADHQL
jgi:hypothetical protein